MHINVIGGLDQVVELSENAPEAITLRMEDLIRLAMALIAANMGEDYQQMMRYKGKDAEVAE